MCFFANFLSRHHLSCLQSRAASQSSELSSAADARRRLEKDVSRLRAETDKALKARKRRTEGNGDVRNLIFCCNFKGAHISAGSKNLIMTKKVGLKAYLAS